jgi:pyridoxamine 5'-phosphate oxidase
MDSPAPTPPANLPSVADLRRDYKMASLEEANLHPDPIQQFSSWFADAQRAQLAEPNAMTLATVTEQGRPSARIVLLKGFDQNGFCFYTNYESRKGKELAQQPFACLVFLWAELERQVRIEGSITRLSQAESDAYFETRPLNSRYGACVSPQSAVITDRQVLIDKETVLRAQFGEHPPRPAHWGGYRLRPELIEFWQGRRSRLHDRLVYKLDDLGQASTSWSVMRLAP